MKKRTTSKIIVDHNSQVSIIKQPIVKEDHKNYLQIVMLRGRWLERTRRFPNFSDLEASLQIKPPVPGSVALRSVGKYFQPFIRDEEAACECFEYEHDAYLEFIKLLKDYTENAFKYKIDEIEEAVKKLLDLSPLVSQLRLGDA